MTKILKLQLNNYLNFLLIITLLLMASPLSAQDIEFPANKIGAYYWEFQGGKFDVENKSNQTSGNQTGNAIGNVAFIERIIFDVFGIGIKYGAGLKRELEFDIGTNEITVDETSSFWTVNLISYTSNHLRDGLKGYVQVGYGSLTVESTITTTPSGGSSSEDTTSAAIPLRSFALGVDYIIAWFGMRLELGYTNGHRTDLEGGSTYYAEYDFNTLTAGASLYYFF